MNPCFPDNIYQTPSGKRCLLDRLFLGSRFPLHLKLFACIRNCSRDVVDGTLSKEDFKKASLTVINALEQCGARVTFSNLDAISPVKEPAVFIGNHMSLVETMVLSSIIIERQERPVSFVVKESLLKYPYFGQILKGIDAISVGRDNPRDDLKAVLEGGKGHLDRGVSLVIFPQSTRSVEFHPEKFNSIGVKLARKANVPVVPFALKTDFFENGKLVKDLGPIHRERPIHIEFHPAMRIEGNGKAEHQQIIDFIQGKLAQWRVN